MQVVQMGSMALGHAGRESQAGRGTTNDILLPYCLACVQRMPEKQIMSHVLDRVGPLAAVKGLFCPGS